MYKACGIVDPKGSRVFEIVLIAGQQLVRVVDGGKVRFYTQKEIAEIGKKLFGKEGDN